MTAEPSFHLFTSLRYDPALERSDENSSPILNFHAPSPFYMLVYHRDRMLEAAQHFDFSAVATRLQDGLRLHQDLLEEVHRYQKQESTDNVPLKLRILFDPSATLTIDFAPIPPVPLSTLYPLSFDPPKPAPSPPPHFKPSPLTGGALTLGPTDSLPQSTSLSPPTPPTISLRLDTHPTPTTPFTLLKTTLRTHYDASRARALPPHPSGPAFAEVLLWNPVREITEGTLTSVYLFRGGRWVTPPVGVPAGELTAEVLKEMDGEERGDEGLDEGELRRPFAGRWGHSVRSAKVGAGGQRGTSRRWALKRGFCMEEPVGVGTVEVGEGVWVSNGVRGFSFGRVVE